MSTLEFKNTTSPDDHRIMEDEEFKQLELLPKEQFFGLDLFLYQGFWCRPIYYGPVVTFQNHFQAHDTDIIMASMPKTGTTWLKSLLFTLVNRKIYSPNDISQHPLRTKSPHELVHQFEITIYQKINGNKYDSILENLASPRVFATHVPFPSLPDSIRSSNCRIVYICRNPIDTFVSLWHFCKQIDQCKNYVPLMSMEEELVEKYLKGVAPFGPYDEHVLGYWKESLKNPQKVLVLEYEGLKKDPKSLLKKLAEFLGCPFSEEEEKGNVIEDILEICSIKSLKEMDANKSGKFFLYDKSSYFRKGEIGDWSNELTPLMAKQFDQVMERLNKAGFSFKYY